MPKALIGGYWLGLGVTWIPTKREPVVHDGVEVGYRLFSHDGMFGTWRFRGYEWHAEERQHAIDLARQLGLTPTRELVGKIPVPQ